MRERGLKRGADLQRAYLRGSLPMRERGLKLFLGPHTQHTSQVAPHAGAWIETSVAMAVAVPELVAPHAGAWIETYLYVPAYWIALVAPHAGAWIETNLAEAKCQAKAVAPHAGAWIETVLVRIGTTLRLGRSPCGSVD